MHAEVYRSAADYIETHISAGFPLKISTVDPVNRVQVLVVARAGHQVMPDARADHLECMIVARGVDHGLRRGEGPFDRRTHDLVSLAKQILVRIDDPLKHADRKPASAMRPARL